MAWIPQSVDEALARMERRTQYLAYQFSVDYPPTRADLEQAGRIATAKAYRYFRPGAWPALRHTARGPSRTA